MRRAAMDVLQGVLPVSEPDTLDPTGNTTSMPLISRVAAIVQSASREGASITLAGILERPTIKGVAELEDVRACLNHLVSEGMAKRDDLSGGRSTYCWVNGHTLPAPSAIPRPTPVHNRPARDWGVTAAGDDQLVLSVIPPEGLKRGKIAEAAGLDLKLPRHQNALSTVLHRLEKRGKIERCLPYGSYRPCTDKPPQQQAAPKPAAPAPAPAAPVAAAARIVPRAQYQEVLADLERRLAVAKKAASEVDALQSAIDVMKDVMP
jgi:hypothetical protein